MFFYIMFGKRGGGGGGVDTSASAGSNPYIDLEFISLSIISKCLHDDNSGYCYKSDENGTSINFVKKVSIIDDITKDFNPNLRSTAEFAKKLNAEKIILGIDVEPNIKPIKNWSIAVRESMLGGGDVAAAFVDSNSPLFSDECNKQVYDNIGLNLRSNSELKYVCDHGFSMRKLGMLLLKDSTEIPVRKLWCSAYDTAALMKKNAVEPYVDNETVGVCLNCGTTIFCVMIKPVMFDDTVTVIGVSCEYDVTTKTHKTVNFTTNSIKTGEVKVVQPNVLWLSDNGIPIFGSSIVCGLVKHLADMSFFIVASIYNGRTTSQKLMYCSHDLNAVSAGSKLNCFVNIADSRQFVPSECHIMCLTQSYPVSNTNTKSS